MPRHTVHPMLLAAALSLATTVAGPARADGIVSFDVGDSHVCIGVWSCLFKKRVIPGRDGSGTSDHRTPGDADGTDPSNIRDHRPIVRDHRR